jgi:hypothetical protein
MKICLICSRKEPGKTQPYPDVEFICSDCVQKLCRASQEQIRAVYQKAVDRGLDRKAEIFKTFMSDDEEYDPKAGETRPNMVRKRSMRSTRPTRN